MDKHWVFLVAHEDSFEMMRLARKLARERGFKVGWHPHKKGEAIVFSSGGGAGSSYDS